MIKRLLTSIISILLLILFVGCSTTSNVPTEDLEEASDFVAASDLIVESDFFFDYGDFLSYSPDGKFIIDLQHNKFCIERTDPPGEQECSEHDLFSQVDWNYASWSPDGLKLAFTEDSAIKLFESDIWVYLVESGEFLNLTDDGQSGLMADMDHAVPIDSVPTWSPDSQSLIFSRSDYADDRGTALYRISVEGGEPEKIIQISDYPMMVWSKMYWSQNGNIFYTVRGQRFDLPESGIWMANDDGSQPEQLITGEESDFGLPILVSVSPKGKNLIVWYDLEDYKGPDPKHWMVFDVNKKAFAPIMQLRDDSKKGIIILQATFSPDGSKLLYFVSFDDACLIEVQDVNGRSMKIISMILRQDYNACGTGKFRTIQWTLDNKIFATVGVGHHLVVQLGAAE